VLEFRTVTAAGAPRRPKGHREFSWNDPGEWILDAVQQLSYHSFGVGEDERGSVVQMIVVKYDPGARIEPHYHECDYCSIVVEGSIEVTRRVHDVGSVRVVKAGTVYGPLVAGPDGCTVIDIFATGEPGSRARAMNTYVTADNAAARSRERSPETTRGLT
jgi:quercetin dioxygenase-like cupin family protein